jgi:hypothetical protein
VNIAQVTRLCCPLGIVWSTGFLPVKSSKRTTPKYIFVIGKEHAKKSEGTEIRESKEVSCITL